jgi:hypothetical protein
VFEREEIEPLLKVEAVSNFALTKGNRNMIKLDDQVKYMNSLWKKSEFKARLLMLKRGFLWMKYWKEIAIIVNSTHILIFKGVYSDKPSVFIPLFG